MMKFDHLNLPASDLARSRDWYIATLGLKVEFEMPDRRTVALRAPVGRALDEGKMRASARSLTGCGAAP